jgi:radical SAM superfamily enzyme YgiQ (UPF0313 family)
MKLEKILLIHPLGLQSEGFTSFATNPKLKAQLENAGVGFKAPMAPSSMATIAALTPPEIDVEVWDEAVRGPVDDALLSGRYDLAGITGFYLHRPRILDIAATCRTQGTPCVLGGPGVSSEPEDYRGRLDYIFIGEAELTWPQFIEDFRAGRPQPEYRQIEKPDLGSVPVPRWDLIPDLGTSYAMVPVQTARGCPFDCEFCDVIHLFGRRSRRKPVERVLAELRDVEARGTRRIFFSDDNFIGHPPYAKELLRALIQLNSSFKRPLTFFTQLTINVAKDEELLELLADANFARILIGIESANPESLREANKPQNFRTDLLADIHKIHSYGLAIHGQMVIGFDHDGPEIFEQTYQFVQQSGIPMIILNILHALPGTKLWHRLRREHRILELGDAIEQGFAYRSNIRFKGMSRAEVFRGFVSLYRRIYSPEAISERLNGMLRQVKRRPRVPRHRLQAFREDRRPVRGVLRLLLFNEDEAMRRVFRRSLLHTLLRAPFLMEHLAAAMAGTLIHRYYTEALAPQYEALIQKEEKRPPRALPDQVVTIPASFPTDYKAVFPSVYLRLMSRLQDKGSLQTGLVTVFSDFLERFHDEYERLGEQSFMQLQEICDRTIAGLNGDDPTAGSWPDAPTVRPVDRFTDKSEKQVARKVHRDRLDDDIFHAVEQDLFRSEERRAAGQFKSTPIVLAPATALIITSATLPTEHDILRITD